MDVIKGVRLNEQTLFERKIRFRYVLADRRKCWYISADVVFADTHVRLFFIRRSKIYADAKEMDNCTDYIKSLCSEERLFARVADHLDLRPFFMKTISSTSPVLI